MSYTPNEWKTGDVVTADKLNKLESGIVSNGTFRVNFILDTTGGGTSGTGTSNKTIAEIQQAWENGMNVIGVADVNGLGVIILSLTTVMSGFGVGFSTFTEGMIVSVSILKIEQSENEICRWNINSLPTGE